jgi:hypothetical protein
MELVKYVSYMDNDQRQAERFVYGLNPKIRAMVRMWKPSSVAEAVENARYAEEHMNLTRRYETDLSASSWICREGP